jgi:ATP-dependent DNA helicase RecG
MINEQELKNMLFDMESDRVERKENAKDTGKICQNICAFANDLPNHGKSGVIFIGIKDDGSCGNLHVDDTLMCKMADIRNDNILPIPSINIQKFKVDHYEIAAIIVEPSYDPPVRYKGTVYVRIGPTTRAASPDDERRLSEKRRSNDLPFDHRPVKNAALSVLNLNFFEETYIPQTIAVLEQNNRDLEQKLFSLRFLQNNAPTYGAILAIGKDPLNFVPGAFVQFIRFSGTSLTDPVMDQKELSGPLYEILVKLEELIKININVAIDFTSASLEIKMPDYPLVALQQFVRNAVMHRTYEHTNAPVKIYWFSDRIEITSPGGLYGRVDIDNFGKGANDYRNPFIAEFMKNLGYVQKFGAGIPAAINALKNNNNPPAEFPFELGPEYFCVTVRKRT